jgi:hypothetical protein
MDLYIDLFIAALRDIAQSKIHVFLLAEHLHVVIKFVHAAGLLGWLFSEERKAVQELPSPHCSVFIITCLHRNHPILGEGDLLVDGGGRGVSTASTTSTDVLESVEVL